MLRFAVALLLFVLGAGPACGWSQLGHRLIGELAERRLSPAARAHVSDLLRDEVEPGLANVASWADYLRSLPAHEWTSPLHYVNIHDRGCRFDPARDCAGDACVVGAIQRYARKLGDPSLSRAERAEALKFIVHFVGDVHQPLHAGWRPDEGGNLFQISLDLEGTNMHSVWDYYLLAGVGESFPVHVGRLQLASTPASRVEFLAIDAARWAEASCAFTNTEGFYPRRPGKLPRHYMQRLRPLAESRVTEAAAHLAQVIETAVGKFDQAAPR